MGKVTLTIVVGYDDDTEYECSAIDSAISNLEYDGYEILNAGVRFE